MKNIKKKYIQLKDKEEKSENNEKKIEINLITKENKILKYLGNEQKKIITLIII